MASVTDRRTFLALAAGATGAAAFGRLAQACCRGGPVFDVRAFGAVGDGRASDTAAVNRAIAAAANAGGGTVHFPMGAYLCDTIHLKSRVDLHLSRRATIVAAPPGGYDPAEPNPWSRYQDYGHGHFHNSLICGDRVEDVAIHGSGLIWAKGLSRDEAPVDGTPSDLAPGVADKVIALKRCRNIVLRGFSILGTGHFGVLATGVDQLRIDGLTIDTSRDGINIDSCWGAEVANCVLNTPNDDSICLKASYALGSARGTRDVVIRDCFVTGGYRVGTMLDGTCRRLPDGAGRRGRIKLGTESDGSFENIRIERCLLQDCLGLAIETVDGGRISGVTVVDLTMRNIQNAPLFLRLGARLRAPPETPVGSLAGVTINRLKCYGFRMPAIICGIPGHAIEDVAISEAFLSQRATSPQKAAAVVPPEQPTLYPETDMFGPLPARLLYGRHVRGLRVGGLEFDTDQADDPVPLIWLGGVAEQHFSGLRLPARSQAPVFFSYKQTV